MKFKLDDINNLLQNHFNCFKVKMCKKLDTILVPMGLTTTKIFVNGCDLFYIIKIF